MMSGHTQNSPQTRKIFAVGGGKGGVGKTAITAAIGIALARRGTRVVVVDADFAGSNLHQAFGIPSPPITLLDFLLSKNADINQYILETSIPNLSIIAGAPGRYSFANIRYGLKKKFLLNIGKIDSELILLDIGAGSSFNQLDCFIAANSGIVVMTPEPHALLDAYNFIKLCLARRLFRAFRRDETILEHLAMDQAYSQYWQPANFRKLAAAVDELGDPWQQKWKRIVDSFRPHVVVNMIEEESERIDCLSLQIAAREMLNIAIRSMHYVQYDPDFRRAMRKMQPELLQEGIAPQDIQLFVDKLFYGKNGAHHPIGNFPHKRSQPREQVASDDHQVICSSLCGIWDKCQLRKGGYPCRIKMVGFLNQR